ncbi:hypothetical protein ACFX2G_041210 [Malus domestica]
MQRKGGRFSGGQRFQRRGNFGGGSGGSGASVCNRCNYRHFGECIRGNSGCFTYGQMGHRASQCPQSQQRPQQSSFPPLAHTQQASGSGGYTQAGRGSTYHYQGDTAPYTSGQHQYFQDPQYQIGYSLYQGELVSYQPQVADGSQWSQRGQPQQGEIAANSVGSSRQQGQQRQGRGVHANRGRGRRQQNQGHIHNMSLQDAQNNPDLIMGTLNILGHFARVLIDCGATHFVISHTFAQVTQPHPMPLEYILEFSMPRGDRCFVDRVYPGCPVIIEDVVMPANLMPMDIVDFEVILGADWLHYNHANIDCYGKTVTFHRPGLPEVTFVGEPSRVRHGIISAMKAKRMLSKGCQGYLAHMVLSDDAPSSVEDVRVVRYFSNVFPEEFLDCRQIERWSLILIYFQV